MLKKLQVRALPRQGRWQDIVGVLGCGALPAVEGHQEVKTGQCRLQRLASWQLLQGVTGHADEGADLSVVDFLGQDSAGKLQQQGGIVPLGA